MKQDNTIYSKDQNKSSEIISEETHTLELLDKAFKSVL